MDTSSLLLSHSRASSSLRRGGKDLVVTPLLAGAGGCPPDIPLSLGAPLGPGQLKEAAPAHPSLLPTSSSRAWVGHSSASFLSLLIAGGLKHPDPHPAEQSPTGNSSSPSNTRHRGSYSHWYLWNAMLFPPQHLRGPVPARHFAASQLPGGGGGVSPTIFILLLPAIPSLGCCTHREATQLSAGAGDAAF